MAGLSTPLHLAASLLALATAVGLAIVVGGNARRTRFADALLLGFVALGALTFAAGNALAGALVDGAGAVIPWLRAAGLTLIALGLSSRRLGRLADTVTLGAAALLPAALIPAALAPLVSPAGALTPPVSPSPAAFTQTAPLVAVIAGGVGALRGLMGGRQTALVGIALASWGAVDAVQLYSTSGAAWLTLAGATALGGWLWQASQRRLLAKFVTAFVAALLAVVVLLATVLSSVGTSQLVSDQLSRLRDFSYQLATQISEEWPKDAIRSARAVSPAGERFLALRSSDTAQLARLYDLSFASQDFFLTLDGSGRPINSYAPGARPITPSFLLSVSGSDLVASLLKDTRAGGTLVTIGGELVALGGVRLLPENARAEDRARGVLVTGRRVDRQWASGEAAARGVGLVFEVGGRVTTMSPGLPAAQLVPQGAPSSPSVVQVGSRTFYRAGTPVFEPTTGQPVGRVFAIGTADAIAALQRAQARRLFLFALLAAVFAACAAALVSRRLVAPIRSLTAAAEAVREGDLDVRAQIEAKDEVGDLGRTFNEMTASLAAQSAQLREAATVQTRLRARLEALTASMSDALIAVDSDGRIITFNPAAERLVGRDVADVTGLPLREVLVGQGPGEVDAADALGAPDGQEVIAAQVLLEAPQGRWIPTSVTAAPVRDISGRVLGRVFVLRDVTREAELERMKTEFLANVSHELRTPLTPIRGYAEVLARRDVGRESTRRFAEQILISTSRLERIVGMIVEFAALDSGRLVPKPEPVDLGMLVADVLGAWRDRDGEREFRLRIPACLPPVFVDRAMLSRCLDELLDNAVKFSPGGEPVVVSATLEPGEPARGSGAKVSSASPKGTVAPEGTPGKHQRTRLVRLSVHDRGVGIEPETAVRVFSDFYQVDATETRHFGGLGLGLALVRRILDGLDGDARVESEVGKGSTFHLLLPVAETQAPRMKTDASAPEKGKPDADAPNPTPDGDVRSRRGA
jgi:two-component system, OmpR family, phosphate regulon sensor histidine kinase PhoR